MSIKLSNSGMVKHSGCARSYKYHYIDKLRSKFKGSALFFGSAIDSGCNFMLEHFDARKEPDFLKTAIDIFYATWSLPTDQDSGVFINLKLSPNIKYFKADFDPDILTPEDWNDLGLNSGEAVVDYLAFRKEIETSLKTIEWGDIPEEARIRYNHATWLSLNRKGPMMLTAYFNEILPKFKRILTLQRKVELEDANGNLVNGIVEFVAELQDGKICLVDNKTSGADYAEDSVRTSQQLALYYQILNIQASTPNAEWQQRIDVAAYAVMGKKIARNKVCTICKNVATGSHKSCNAVSGSGTRCNGEWDVTFYATTQFVLDEISDDYGSSVLENASTIIACIEKGIFPKNFDKCYNDFGGTCPFLKMCHKKDDSDLIKIQQKEK